MENEIFKITIGAEYKPNIDLYPKYIVSCDPYKVVEPKNFYHKIRKALGMKYKESGWAYAVTENKQGIEINGQTRQDK